MAWAQNPTPGYAVGPIALQPVALSPNAYAGGGVVANATKIYAADGQRRPAFSLISLTPVGPLSAGKFVLLTSAAVGGTVLTEVDEIAVASQSGYSVTVSGTLITFPRWSSSTPLVLPEVADLYIASMVAQASPPIVYGYGKTF